MVLPRVSDSGDGERDTTVGVAASAAGPVALRWSAAAPTLAVECAGIEGSTRAGAAMACVIGCSVQSRFSHTIKNALKRIL